MVYPNSETLFTAALTDAKWTVGHQPVRLTPNMRKCDGNTIPGDLEFETGCGSLSAPQTLRCDFENGFKRLSGDVRRLCGFGCKHVFD